MALKIDDLFEILVKLSCQLIGLCMFSLLLFRMLNVRKFCRCYWGGVRVGWGLMTMFLMLIWVIHACYPYGICFYTNMMMRIHTCGYGMAYCMSMQCFFKVIDYYAIVKCDLLWWQKGDNAKLLIS